MNKDKIKELLESEDLKDNRIGMQMLRTLTLEEVYEIVKSTNFIHANAFPNGNIVDFVIATLFDAPVNMLRGLCRKGGISWQALPEWVKSRRYEKAVPGRYLIIPYDEPGNPGFTARVETSETWRKDVLGMERWSVDTPEWSVFSSEMETQIEKFKEAWNS